MQEVTCRVFTAMQKLDIAALSKYPPAEIRPVLPALVRMSLLSPLDNTKSSMDSRKQILALLIGNEVVNSIVSYLQVNYHELEVELKKELQVRQKTMYFEGQQSSPNSEFGLQTGIALGFERADVTRKVRVVLSEIFNIQHLLSASDSQKSTTGQSTGSITLTQLGASGISCTASINTGTTTITTTTSATSALSSPSVVGGGSSGSGNTTVPIQSEILEDGIYLEEVVDIICIALAELPTLLTILELTDTLMQIPNGHRIICALVANFPDCYREVMTHIIMSCDDEISESKQKLQLLMNLNDMNPSQTQWARALCVDNMKVPTFMLKLTLKLPEDLVR